MAAKCDPDSIYLDGMEGSTGAGPHIAAANTGIPGIAAIREARRALDDVGQSGKVTLIYAGGVRDGADLAKALAISAPSLIPPAKTSDTSPVFPTSSKALLASLTAAIPGIPVLAAAICGPAPVDPSIQSK